jgi:hypothetical protein
MPIGPKVQKVPLAPKVQKVSINNPNNINDVLQLRYCDKGKIINPFTNRCVLLSSTIGKKLTSVPHAFINPSSKTKIITKQPGLQKVPLAPKVQKVSINNPDNVNEGIKVVVPQNLDDVLQLHYCGQGKIINPFTGKCVLLSSTIGKKLTSVPHVFINPSSQTKIITKQPTNKTGLDTDGDNYVSIKEYLDVTESLGPSEIKGGNFKTYTQTNLGTRFLLILIKKLKGPIHNIACIPLYKLCIYLNASSEKYHTLKNIFKDGKLSCPSSEDPMDITFSQDEEITYGSIMMWDAYINKKENTKKMNILMPPNFQDLIKQCEDDNKYMVVCSLKLLAEHNIGENTSHANALIFDTKRKTIERFDPHGGNEYKDVKLAYDTNSYGKHHFGEKSNAFYNQVKIDTELSNKFKSVLPNYTYYGTNITTPYLGPQLKADAYGGLCVTWSTMYMVLRLLNPDLSPSDVTTKMIDGTPTELKNRILRFQKFIINTLKNEKTDIFT